MKYLTMLCLTGSLAFAAIDDEPPIRAGTLIEIQAWDARSRTYDITMPAFSAQGPNYATLPALIKAVPSLNTNRIKANPDSIVGMTYKLDAPLALEPVLKTEAKRKGK